jgi:hypothetical protein
MAEPTHQPPPAHEPEPQRPPQHPPQPQRHVKLTNKGQAAQVFYDEGRSVRVGPGESIEADLTDEAIERLKAVKHSNPEEPPPLEVTPLGEAGNEASGHKRRPAPTG